MSTTRTRAMWLFWPLRFHPGSLKREERERQTEREREKEGGRQYLPGRGPGVGPAPCSAAGRAAPSAAGSPPAPACTAPAAASCKWTKPIAPLSPSFKNNVHIQHKLTVTQDKFRYATENENISRCCCFSFFIFLVAPCLQVTLRCRQVVCPWQDLCPTPYS